LEVLRNYITIAIRNLIKYKGFSFINITGLAIGITCCFSILLFVKDELSYDKFNTKSDRTYKINIELALNKSEAKQSVTCAPLAEAMIREFPEVETAVRIRNSGFPVLRYKEKVFSEERFFNADSNVFEVFTIPFISGDPKTALTKPNTLVLTETMAKKYFGSEDPIGKTINSDNRTDYKVTGVVKDFPKNSHWHFDFLSALAGTQQSRNTVWLNNNFHTYVLLKENTLRKNVDEKINKTLEKFIAPQVLQFTGSTWEQLKQKGSKYNFFLMPLEDIHLHANFDYDIETNSDIAYVYIFSITAIGILIIACFNFMNLSTARALRRAKEVGIRKTLGSNFNQLVRQFLAESIVLSFISVILAVLFVNLLLPVLNDISGKSISLNIIENIKLLPIFILFILLVGVAAGIYPAFFLASFEPVSVLAGRQKISSKGKIFRSGMVILQFSISIILLIGTIVIYSQLKYIQTKKLGYNKDQVIIIHKVDDIGKDINAFKEELLRNPKIISLSNSTSLPGKKDFNNNAHSVSRTGGEGIRLLMAMTSDYEFQNTYQIEMAAGRYYARDRLIDTVSSVVINEAAVKALEFNEPLGREIIIPNNPPIVLNVIGVMKDFHFESLHSEIRPMIVYLFRARGYGKYLSVRVNPENIQNTLSFMKNVWSKFAGNQAFEYTFHDDDFAKLYESDQRTGKLFAVFSLFGIFIACLGLLGLAAHIAERRIKEIGIRKALGSSVQSIVVLLSQDFTKWIIISNIIAWPIAYYLMNKWLQNFAYRIDLNIWFFIISGLLAFIIALLTVSYQSIKAAMANPVNSLKYE
jgi:putative ABC transport system permease protein